MHIQYLHISFIERAKLEGVRILDLRLENKDWKRNDRYLNSKIDR
jgi:hypothetical protein